MTAAPTATAFGEMLRQLRSERGFSQNRLARGAGLDPAYVNRLERTGQRSISGLIIPDVTPSRQTVLGLAAVLGLDAGQTDRFLQQAGLAPITDWQAAAAFWQAEARGLRRRLAIIREALDAAEMDP